LGSKKKVQRSAKYWVLLYALYRWIGNVNARIRRALRYLSPVNLSKVAKLKKMRPLKVNIGCGKIKYEGWINIDIDHDADIVLDVRKGLPFDDESVDFIYNEHFLEHLTFEESSKLLGEIYRCLKKDGVVRIATPDLDYVIQKYCKDWKDQDWLQNSNYDYIKTKGNMINVSFREWGHKYLFNEEDLRKHLLGAGFKFIERCTINQSHYVELRGLETRSDSKLIIEATK
jgi:predicted SAM-dependent methyltransferase